MLDGASVNTSLWLRHLGQCNGRPRSSKRSYAEGRKISNAENQSASMPMPEALQLKPASRIADAVNGMLSAASSISSAARHGDAYTLAKRPLIYAFYALEQNRNPVNHNGYTLRITASGRGTDNSKHER
jgi:hypothetical protein